MTDPKRLLELAARCEAEAVGHVEHGFSGYDHMQHGKIGRAEAIANAANLFTCAAALRALATGADQ